MLYDLIGAPTNGATVSVAFSATAGAPYSIVPAAAVLSGDVGAGITSGANRRLVWDCALTLPPQAYGTAYRAAVTATDPAGEGQQLTVTLPGGVPLAMVRIPGETFTMGSPEGERGHRDDEAPQHQVTITQPFYLSATEVTQAQWQAVMGTNPSYFSGCGTCPVEQVSWNDIAGPPGFIQKVNQHQGSTKFRLPTEAEWEYAARAGTTTEFSFPADANWSFYCWGVFPEADTYMWWCGNASPYESKPVGQKAANPWGLLDMHGNVEEWVADWYGGYSPSPQTDPQGPGPNPYGPYRVARGGSRSSNAFNCRSAARLYANPDHRSGTIGFRLARSQ